MKLTNRHIRLSFLLVFILLAGCGGGGGNRDEGNTGAVQDDTNSTTASIRISAPTTDIPAFIVGTSTTLTATVFIPSKGESFKISAAPYSLLHVSLERLNSEGVVISNLGDLHDDGLNGDAIAGDGVFSIQTTFQEQVSEPVRLRVIAVSGSSLLPTISETITIPVYQIPAINTPSDYNWVVDNLFTNLVTIKDTFVNLNGLLSDSQSSPNSEEIIMLLETLTQTSMLAYTNIVALKMFGYSQTDVSVKAGYNKPRFVFGWIKDITCAIPLLGSGCTISDIGQVGNDALNLAEIVRKNGADPRVPPETRSCLLQQMSEAELSDPSLDSLRGAVFLRCPKGSGGFLDAIGNMAATATKFEIGQALGPVINAAGDIISTVLGGGEVAIQTAVNYVSGKVIDWFVDDSGEEKIRVSEISSSTPAINVPGGTHNLIVSYGSDTAPSIVPNVVVLQGSSTSISAPPGSGTTFVLPPDTTPPQVSSTGPANGATGVPVNATVSATFNEAMNTTTLTTSTFTVSNSSGAVSGTVSYTGTATAVFTPSANLTPNTFYTATITTGVKDVAGNALAASYTWSFTTGPGTATPKKWGTPVLIGTDDAGSAAGQQIAVDPFGNAIAVWHMISDGQGDIWANRFVAGVGWGTATRIEDNAGNALNPQVAIDASGNAIAVWDQYQGNSEAEARSSIWANRFVAGVGWGTATRIEDNAESALNSRVAIDASGNAVAVWMQFDHPRWDIWANRFVAGVGWGTATRINTENTGVGANPQPQVAIDPSGNAIAVWDHAGDTGRRDIWANRFVVGSGWGTATLIETDNRGGAGAPQVAVDPSGNAIAVWAQSDGTQCNIWANRFVAGVGWGTATLIGTDNTGTVDYPQVAVDPSGKAIVVWDQQSDETGRKNIWANRFDGSSWGTATLIETHNGDGIASDAPQVAVDSSGNAIVVWQQYWVGTVSLTNNANIWYNRFDGSGWGTATLIEASTSGGPQVAVDPSGNAIVVWLWGEAPRSIWASRFE